MTKKNTSLLFLPALLILACSAFGQTVTIGRASFPLGEVAFPDFTECLDVAGCGSGNILVDATDPLFPQISASGALLAHRLDLVALDLDATDEIRMTFPQPIVNQPGDDVYVSQARFLGTLDGLGDAVGINGAELRFGASGAWNNFAQSDFRCDLLIGGPVFVTFQDPELKQDAYGVEVPPLQPPIGGLWFITADLADYGIAAGASITEVSIRGVTNSAGSGLDAVVVGNLDGGVSIGNIAPVADGGPDQSPFVGQVVQLDGNLSSDGDCQSLAYNWTLTSVPAGSSATLSDGAAVNPTFVADVAGTYVVQLVVNDGQTDSAAVFINATTANRTPVADAGVDQSSIVGQTVQLDGSGSSDPDGDPLIYVWTLVSAPAGSSATLSNANTVNPTFLADIGGTYAARLIVNDGMDSSPPDVVLISTQNSAPVADAGPDQLAFVGSTVFLNGAASTDVDGDTLTYNWALTSVPAGSGATISDIAAVNPTFLADVSGDYAVQLIVNDGQLDSAPDSVTISTQNAPPVADAGPDQSPFVGETVQLDGAGSSDMDGDALTYRWGLTSIPASSSATLSDAAAVNPTFSADASGTYIVQLIVNDGQVDSAADAVVVSTQNSMPVADAGPDQSVFVTETVQLNGGASSDVDGDLLTYGWALIAVPGGSGATISDTIAVSPTFLADVSGSYVAQLMVNDGLVDSAPDTVTISTLNSPPVANAGPDQSPFVGATVQLNGSGSSDVDGDTLTYRWALTSSPAGSSTMLLDAAAVNPTFPADVSGTYVVQLIVNDGQVDSAPVTVTVSTQNSIPVADAGLDQSVLVTETVQLNGSGSTDVDGDPLTYTWALITVPAGSGATLANSSLPLTSFGVDVPGTYIAQLIVNDGSVDSSPDSLSISTINSAPVADSGPDQSVLVGQMVLLDGSGSSDVDGDPLTYSWALMSVPAGSNATLSDAALVDPNFLADVSGDYVVQLIVNDGFTDSVPNTMTASTQNVAPVADAGADQTRIVGQLARVNGEASSDADGDALTYRWALVSIPAGSSAALSDNAAMRSNFLVDVFGTYIVQLIVNDGLADSAPDTVTITTPNIAPVAAAGADQVVIVGRLVQLDGGASTDAEGDLLTYQWTLINTPAGSSAVLSDAMAPNPTFLANVSGEYMAQLIVNDGQLDSAPDTVTITTLNTAPAAAAGADQVVIVGRLVQLDGGASTDAEGDLLTYQWTLTNTPAGSSAVLSDAMASNPTFLANVSGEYTAQLIVNDGQIDSAPDSIRVIAETQEIVARASSGGSLGPGQLLLLALAVFFRSRRGSYELVARTRLRIILAGVFLCLIVVPQQTAKATNFSLDFGGDFTLTDQNNQAFSLSDARGKVVMIFFGFTSCADTCPTTMIKMAAAMKQLGSSAEQVLPVFISVDSKRDTPDVIRQYAEHFHPSMVALTGTQQEVEAVAKQYRTPVLVRKPSENGFYVVDHGSRLFFVDRQGGLANILMFEGSAEQITSIVKELLEE